MARGLQGSEHWRRLVLGPQLWHSRYLLGVSRLGPEPPPLGLRFGIERMVYKVRGGNGLRFFLVTVLRTAHGVLEAGVK